jgi:hypothetical protein
MTKEQVTMPKEVFDAIEALVGEFLNADLYERVKYFRCDCADNADDQAFADELEAAAELYEDWRKETERSPTGYFVVEDPIKLLQDSDR